MTGIDTRVKHATMHHMTDLIAEEETWVPSYTDFGARLAAVRWGMRWNIKEAALACQIPPQSWRQWELGEVLPRDISTVARRIAERTGVDFLWMLSGTSRRGAEVLHDVPTLRRESRGRRPLYGGITGQRPNTMQHSAVRPTGARPAVGNDRSGQSRRPQRVAVEAA
jgi:hypothetical protein